MKQEQQRKSPRTQGEPKGSAGLGRSLGELLDDNDGIPNMRCNVVMRRNDGSCVKIYDKTGGEAPAASKPMAVKKR